MKYLAPRCLIGAVLCFETSSFAQSPPINDNFENRIILSGSSVTFAGTLANATIQAGEPSTTYYHGWVDATVWWSWTAPATGPATLEVLDASTNAFKPGGIDVWTGTN